jgi:hypothetical protein
VKLQLFVYCMQRDSELRTTKMEAQLRTGGAGGKQGAPHGDGNDRLQEAAPNVEEYVYPAHSLNIVLWDPRNQRIR